MKKVILVSIGLLISLLLIAGCEEEIRKTNTTGENLANNTDESSDDEEPLPQIPPKPGDCPGKFICISSIVSAYQDTNCKITNRTTCKTECGTEGICKEKEIKICTPGFKCRSQQERGFQREDCAWDKKEKCEFGCNTVTNKCANQSSAVIPAPNITAVPKTADPIITFGETVEISAGNLSIYLLEPGRVQLKLNSKRSDWIEEGQNYTFPDATISIKEILFQAYDGGKKQVVYTVG